MRAWSRQLAAVRKDVECTFGILKGRFRILKLPFECHKEEKIDHVFFTCCALHNQIQAETGFHKVWEKDEHWMEGGGKFTDSELGTQSQPDGHQWAMLVETLARHYDSILRTGSVQ